LDVNAKNGDVRLEPATAAMYGGQYRGSVQVDATQAVPRLNMDQRLTGVDFAPLLKDLYKTERVAGKGTATIKVNGSGRDSVALVKSLAGTMDFNVADGAFLGTDLVYEIRRAQALLKQQAIPERTGPARTPFNALHASGVIQNGILTNKDLEVAAPVLKMTGQGTVDLAQQSLNYRLSTSILKATDENAGGKDLLGTSIPVLVTGPLSSPSIKPDIEGLVREKAKQKLDEQKDKLEQKLRDKLKGILGG
jgi:AsmA protein